MLAATKSVLPCMRRNAELNPYHLPDEENDPSYLHRLSISDSRPRIGNEHAAICPASEPSVWNAAPAVGRSLAVDTSLASSSSWTFHHYHGDGDGDAAAL